MREPPAPRLLREPETVDTSNVRRHRFVWSLVLWAALAANSVVAPTAEAFRGADGRILADTGDPPELVTMAPDGTEPRPLGAGAAGSWSPVGSRIVFEADGDLELMRSDGSGRTPVTSGDELDGEPSWSPDGDRIVFVREDALTGNRALYLLRLGGGTPTPIAVAAISPTGPRWSPDGRTILFLADEGGHADLFLVDVAGGVPMNVTGTAVDESPAAWSPDGRRLIFTAPTESGQSGLYVMDATGANRSLLLASDEPLGAAAWSPDGGRVAVAVGGTSVLVVDVADPANRTAADPGLSGIGHLDWQPRCTVSGTPGRDVLVGTWGPDLICGLGGDDTIRGLGGADSIFGGRGADDLLGGDGKDVLVGGPGADRLEGGNGDDLLSARDQTQRNDAAGGGAGSDRCRIDSGDRCEEERSSFGGTSVRIDAATRDRMVGSSWRAGCPVPIRNLRYLRLNHRDFDGRVRRGELVVHKDHAGRVLRAMERVWQARFPIARMRLVDDYGADDRRSMAANNTSAFNCRSVVGRPGVWSQHSYGWAIDINPVQNPFVMSNGTVLPPAGASYVDRSRHRRGMIHHGDVVFRAFASIGWEWGGDWSSSKDYQHFSATGR